VSNKISEALNNAIDSGKVGYGYVSDPAAARYVMDGLIDAENAVPIADECVYVLKQIISDLPTSRDWLDPGLERRARALLKKLEASQ